MMATPLAGAFISLLIGLLLGLERQRSKQSDEGLFAGIRTFPLFCLCGYFGALAAEKGAPLALPAVLLAVGGFGLAAFLRAEPGSGVTTEMAAVLTALLGAAVAWGLTPVAAAVAVVMTLLLTLKAPLHRIAGSLSEDEIVAILKFGIVALIVVPLLPAEAMGPFDAVEPRRIGIVVVLLSGVSLVGYLLVRIFGGRAGWPLAGLLGGLVSSTAVTLSLSSKAREGRNLAPALAIGVILASTVLYLRGAVVIGLLDRPLVLYLAPRLGALFLVGLAFAAVQYRRGQKREAQRMELGNPVELGRAILIALIFAAVVVLARWAQASLGDRGLWAIGLAGGLVDVDSVAVAAARLRQQELTEVSVAGGAYLLATLSNLAFKAGVVIVTGGLELARRVLPAFAAMAAATGAILAFW